MLQTVVPKAGPTSSRVPPKGLRDTCGRSKDQSYTKVKVFRVISRYQKRRVFNWSCHLVECPSTRATSRPCELAHPWNSLEGTSSKKNKEEIEKLENPMDLPSTYCLLVFNPSKYERITWGPDSLSIRRFKCTIYGGHCQKQNSSRLFV